MLIWQSLCIKTNSFHLQLHALAHQTVLFPRFCQFTKPSIQELQLLFSVTPISGSKHFLVVLDELVPCLDANCKNANFQHSQNADGNPNSDDFAIIVITIEVLTESSEISVRINIVARRAAKIIYNHYVKRRIFFSTRVQGWSISIGLTRLAHWPEIP